MGAALWILGMCGTIVGNVHLWYAVLRKDEEAERFLGRGVAIFGMIWGIGGMLMLQKLVGR